MNYLHNLTKANEFHLRHQAQQIIIIMKLNRVDPPIGKEVVEYSYKATLSCGVYETCNAKHLD